MSISEREQAVLDSIENDLVGSGPELASKLAMFVRLTAGEAMPKRERIRRSVYPLSAGPMGAGASTGTGVGADTAASADAGASATTDRVGARRIIRWLRRRTAWRLLWVVAAIALIAFLLTLDRGAGKGTCTASQTAACRQMLAPPQSGVGAANGP